MGTAATGEGASGAGGAPANGGAGSGSGAGGGQGASGTAGSGAGSGAGNFDPAQLDPALRGMSPTEINQLFNQMVIALRAPVTQPTPEPAPKPKEPDMRQAFDPNSEGFAPEQAMDHFVRKNYSGLLGEISNRSMEGLYANLRNELPNFSEVEREVRDLLSKRDPTTLRREDVIGAYYGVMGFHVSEDLRKKQRTTPGTSTAAPSARHDPDAEPEPQLTENEKRMAFQFFGDKSDPIKAFREAQKQVDGGREMKVPVGAGKFE